MPHMTIKTPAFPLEPDQIAAVFNTAQVIEKISRRLNVSAETTISYLKENDSTSPKTMNVILIGDKDSKSSAILNNFIRNDIALKDSFITSPAIDEKPSESHLAKVSGNPITLDINKLSKFSIEDFAAARERAENTI